MKKIKFKQDFDIGYDLWEEDFNNSLDEVYDKLDNELDWHLRWRIAQLTHFFWNSMTYNTYLKRFL